MDRFSGSFYCCTVFCFEHAVYYENIRTTNTKESLNSVPTTPALFVAYVFKSIVFTVHTVMITTTHFLLQDIAGEETEAEVEAESV